MSDVVKLNRSYGINRPEGIGNSLPKEGVQEQGSQTKLNSCLSEVIAWSERILFVPVVPGGNFLSEVAVQLEHRFKAYIGWY